MQKPDGTVCGNCRRAQRAFDGIYCDSCTAHLKWKAARDAKAAELRTRRGKFYLTRYLLENMETAVVFGSVLIVRAEMFYERDSIEYFAMSDQFEVVPEGVVTPEYIATVHTEDGKAFKVTWKRA